ncbi:MAG: hypothetical protein ACR2LX_14300 [Jatrophihabitans sp.]
MHIESWVVQVQDQLAAAASLGDERTREIATALATTAGPAVRLAILDALSAAADEITDALLDHPGTPSVAVRPDGDEARIDVRTEPVAAALTEARREDNDATARISLRLSESLKSEIDAAAEREIVSVNTWLVRAAAAALSPGAGPGSPRGRDRGKHDNHRITGWING